MDEYERNIALSIQRLLGEALEKANEHMDEGTHCTSSWLVVDIHKSITDALAETDNLLGDRSPVGGLTMEKMLHAQKYLDDLAQAEGEPTRILEPVLDGDTPPPADSANIYERIEQALYEFGIFEDSPAEEPSDPIRKIYKEKGVIMLDGAVVSGVEFIDEGKLVVLRSFSILHNVKLTEDATLVRGGGQIGGGAKAILYDFNKMRDNPEPPGPDRPHICPRCGQDSRIYVIGCRHGQSPRTPAESAAAKWEIEHPELITCHYCGEQSMYIVEFKGTDVEYHACPKHLKLAVAEKPKPKPLPVVDPKLTDLEREALERMLDDWVADGFTLQPFPEEYYSLFKKLGYKPTAAEYDWQCPNCMATMAGDLPVDRPSKCSNCGASMEPPAEATDQSIEATPDKSDSEAWHEAVESFLNMVEDETDVDLIGPLVWELDDELEEDLDGPCPYELREGKRLRDDYVVECTVTDGPCTKGVLMDPGIDECPNRCPDCGNHPPHHIKELGERAHVDVLAAAVLGQVDEDRPTILTCKKCLNSWWQHWLDRDVSDCGIRLDGSIEECIKDKCDHWNDGNCPRLTAKEPEKPLPVITEAMAAAGLEKVFDKKDPAESQVREFKILPLRPTAGEPEEGE